MPTAHEEPHLRAGGACCPRRRWAAQRSWRACWPTPCRERLRCSGSLCSATAGSQSGLSHPPRPDVGGSAPGTCRDRGEPVSPAPGPAVRSLCPPPSTGPGSGTPPTLQPGWDHGSPQRSSRGHTSPSKQACLWDTSTRALGTCTTAALAGAGQGHHPARPPRGAAPVQTPGSRTAVLRGRQAPLPAPPPLPTVRKARHWHWEGTVPQTPPRQAVSGKDWSCLKVKGWRRPGPRVDNQGRRADVGPQGSDCHLPMSSLPIPGPHPARRAPPAPAQKPKGKWVGRHLTDPTTAVGTDPQAQAHRPRARSCPG